MDDQTTIDPTTVPAGAMPTQTTTAGTTSNSSNGFTQTQETPEDKDAIARQLEASTKQAGLTEQAGDAQATADSQKADLLDQDADLHRQESADAAADFADMQDRVARARQQQADAEDTLKNHKFEDYWGKQSTGHKLLEGLGRAITGFSGNVDAVKALNEQNQALIKQDFDQQRAEYAQKLDQARMKGEDVNQLYSQWEREMALSKTKEAKAHEALAAKMLAAGTRAGIPVGQLTNSAHVQELLAKAQAKRLESQMHYDRVNRHEAATSRSSSTSETSQKGAKGPTPQQLETDAALADLIPDAQSLTKTPLSPDEMKVLLRRLNPSKPHGLGDKIADKVGEWMEPSLDAEGQKRVETAQRLVGRLNPLVGEKRTPESDISVALSRLPTTEDADKTKADRLLQTIRAQAYRTSNPAAFARASTPAPAAPASAPPPPETPEQTETRRVRELDMFNRAKQTMADPNAPAAAKVAAAKIIDRLGR